MAVATASVVCGYVNVNPKTFKQWIPSLVSLHLKKAGEVMRMLMTFLSYHTAVRIECPIFSLFFFVKMCCISHIFTDMFDVAAHYGTEMYHFLLCVCAYVTAFSVLSKTFFSLALLVNIDIHSFQNDGTLHALRSKVTV